jgi:hypothetical protein
VGCGQEVLIQDMNIIDHHQKNIEPITGVLFSGCSSCNLSSVFYQGEK